MLCFLPLGNANHDKKGKLCGISVLWISLVSFFVSDPTQSIE